MKTIFIFNDSRPTDFKMRVTALGEDGSRAATIVFDTNTGVHFEYAMGCKHEFDANVESSVSVPVNDTRQRVLAAYDNTFGSGNWIPMLISPNADNADFRAALALYRQRAEIFDAIEARFSDMALAKIFEAVINPSGPSSDRVMH
ncbi:hypothetical protein G3N59_01085 [Paraburkholderia sp. Ac-20340]|uniref:hypothetical protein n=1 Tax=Paraburkholderia sp. Ac-20340 TaxID=2703888 RepID=UPI001980626C|nr:hypothetical protein [Paraburkholderia sp. Ac-20340]MBN3851961.1 hypothetical protein [Paraburkholderia sp. Ac-20340]